MDLRESHACKCNYEDACEYMPQPILHNTQGPTNLLACLIRGRLQPGLQT